MFLNSAASFATQNAFVRFPHGKWPPPQSSSSSSSSSSSCQWGSTVNHGGKGSPSKGSSSVINRQHNKNHHKVIRAVININKAENNAVPDNQLILALDEQKQKQKQQGLGIEKFLSGKTWFITGATGFVGKVLVEKILRSIPDTRKIYLMIKAKDTEAALHRLKTEIIEAEVFSVLKEEYGESYKSFMLAKLVPVPGNLAPELGIHPETADLVAGEVDLIVNSAANTTLDERYDVAINTNTRGATNLMGFADKCHNLKLFMHISTIYANGGRSGRVMEKAFSEEDVTTTAALDVAAEIQLALTHSAATPAADHLKRLGLERARKFGWHDTYTFTKAMGEMMLGDYIKDMSSAILTNSNKVPIVVLRPSIIEGSYAHPFPGWIEGNRCLSIKTLFMI
ncbi:unnamed protein product [Linum trigynum]|uniref:Fatty acyl-CoA reductase n=1 Tax=Linum trigynum TaxID=586398 RepID=A0AAV2DBL5_9ROSI